MSVRAQKNNGLWQMYWRYQAGSSGNTKGNSSNLVDKGTRLIVKRGEDKAYVVTPISMEELYFTPEMEKRIDQALQSIKDGKGEVMTIEQIEKMLGI
jgi:hypothetical protein